MNTVNDLNENYKTGWIKSYRSMINKGWYKRSEYVHLWTHLLLKANHNQKEFMFNGQNIKVKPGQFITGRKKLSLETGINESKIERILKFFEKSEQQIEQQKTNKSRLISILNWDTYQQSEQLTEQQLNNKRTTSEQQVNTNKNEKNEKNVKNKIPFFDFWNLYDYKKGNKLKLEIKWNKLPTKTQKEIIKYLPEYKTSTPDKKFRKHPATFLNNESWKDEIVKKEKIDIEGMWKD